MQQPFAPAAEPQGDFAALDAQMFGADNGQQEQQAPVQTQQPVVSTEDPSAVVMETLRRMQASLEVQQRTIARLERQNQEVPASLQRTTDLLTQQITDLRAQQQEEREMSGLTLEEQNARLKQQRDEARQAKSQPQTEAQPYQIDRSEPWFVQGMTEQYAEDVVPELKEMADDLGVRLTQDHIDNLRSYALDGEYKVPIVWEQGKPFPDWDNWLRRVVRPALRQEAQRQAEAARAQQGQPRQGSPARQAGPAVGGGSRASTAGTPQIDFFKSSTSDELNAAAWGALH